MTSQVYCVIINAQAKINRESNISLQVNTLLEYLVVTGVSIMQEQQQQ